MKCPYCRVDQKRGQLCDAPTNPGSFCCDNPDCPQLCKYAVIEALNSHTAEGVHAEGQINESMEKNVNHPKRYTKGKIECIDALESAVAGKTPEDAICVANVIKYLWRYEEKEPLRSLMSARWYLDRLIGKYEAHTTTTTSDTTTTTSDTACQSVATDGAVGIGKALCASLEDEQHTMSCSAPTPFGRADGLTDMEWHRGIRLDDLPPEVRETRKRLRMEQEAKT